MSRDPQTCSLTVDDGVAVLTLNNPPVHALQPKVFEALFSQLRKAQSNPDVKAIVITGANGKFCAGFDFTLFGTPQMASILDGRAEVLKELGALVEGGAKPTVAAIQGPCLGGGCELALACNARVCATGALLGLPEVRLGLLPGMGGTQRLPRLVGMAQALNLMMSGAAIPPEDALHIGLVDEVVPPGQLAAAARQAALDLAAGGRPRRKTLQLTHALPASGPGFLEAAQAVADAQAKVQRRLAGQRHYELLLDAVAAGLAQGAPLGLQKEGEGFRAACDSRLHRLTLHFFKADRSLKHASPPQRLLIHVYLFLGMGFMWFYVRLVYIHTSFMAGYNKARSKGRKGGRAAAGGDAGASGSRGAAAPAKKKAK